MALILFHVCVCVCVSVPQIGVLAVLIVTLILALGLGLGLGLQRDKGAVEHTTCKLVLTYPQSFPLTQRDSDSYHPLPFIPRHLIPLNLRYSHLGLYYKNCKTQDVFIPMTQMFADSSFLHQVKQYFMPKEG